VYDCADEKDNTRSSMRLERDPYPAQAGAELKDEQNKVQDTQYQYY
jgi:hypothetical protein